MLALLLGLACFFLKLLRYFVRLAGQLLLLLCAAAAVAQGSHKIIFSWRQQAAAPSGGQFSLEGRQLKRHRLGESEHCRFETIMPKLP